MTLILSVETSFKRLIASFLRTRSLYSFAYYFIYLVNSSLEEGLDA